MLCHDLSLPGCTYNLCVFFLAVSGGKFVISRTSLYRTIGDGMFKFDGQNLSWSIKSFHKGRCQQRRRSANVLQLGKVNFTKFTTIVYGHWLIVPLYIFLGRIICSLWYATQLPIYRAKKVSSSDEEATRVLCFSRANFFRDSDPLVASREERLHARQV